MNHSIITHQFNSLTGTIVSAKPNPPPTPKIVRKKCWFYCRICFDHNEMACPLPIVTMSVNTFVAKEPPKKQTAESIAPPISTARHPNRFMKNDATGPG